MYRYAAAYGRMNRSPCQNRSGTWTNSAVANDATSSACARRAPVAATSDGVPAAASSARLPSTWYA